MANILAVDDNLEVCKLIRTTLERDGHRVETRQAGGALTEPLCCWADCILLDVMMPGEDGFAVCRRIRSLTEAPILFLSGCGCADRHRMGASVRLRMRRQTAA